MGLDADLCRSALMLPCFVSGWDADLARRLVRLLVEHGTTVAMVNMEKEVRVPPARCRSSNHRSLTWAVARSPSCSARQERAPPILQIEEDPAGTLRVRVSRATMVRGWRALAALGFRLGLAQVSPTCALTAAAAGGHRECVQLLLKAGASPNVVQPGKVRRVGSPRRRCCALPDSIPACLRAEAR